MEPSGRGDCLSSVQPLTRGSGGPGDEISDAARSDDAGAEQFFREAWPGLVRLGRLLTGSQQAGEDLAQDAILNLIRQPGPVQAPRAYLRRTMVNLSINGARRSIRERAHILTLRPETSTSAPEPDGLWPHIVRLPARQRAVIVLRYYEDLSEAEIARILDCPPGTVKSLNHRALMALRQELNS
jgi:RNA polymerase sigma factor (sigma-70 family)